MLIDAVVLLEFEFFAGLFLAFAISYFIGWIFRIDDKFKDEHNN